MNFQVNVVTAIAASLTLSACVKSSTVSSGPVGGAGTSTHETLPVGLAAPYDTAADEVTVSVGGVDTILPRSSGGPINGWGAFSTGAQNIALYKTTTSGAGQGIVLMSPVAESDYAGVLLTRNSTTTLPGSGNAVFNGEYAGLFAEIADLVAVGAVSGDAQLTADFSAGTIAGLISNRNVSGGGMADLVLSPATINSNAGFSGSATGGEFVGETASGGTYSGIFVGASGNEAVGGVTLYHNTGGIDYVEVGGFTVSQ